MRGRARSQGRRRPTAARRQERDRFDGSERETTALLTSLHLLPGPPGCDIVVCRLSYRSDAPYEVRLDLLLTEDVQVTWVVGRDLLNAGTEHRSGEGHFKVWPSRGLGDRSLLYLRMERPQGRATFAADLETVRKWLCDTYTLVPAGTETELLDWAAFTRSLLPPV
ncbi:SsgA family sporulation/cell division regulator [Streptomyces carpinensis]|uniref:SsgA family sporulation/cell division regulator n=1 Tax=Streptomyces carpinensis TaxID=66369 RepID=A0ABV1VZ93_9ACTN|nr:SsgA family sporulation/cell division regulator [Streptomyces carpinensis]